MSREWAPNPVDLGEPMLSPRHPLVRAWRWGRSRVIRYFDPGMHGQSVECVDGVELTILPGVFRPRRLRSGAVLGPVLANEVRRSGRTDLRVLDMGTGSGVGAVLAARAGAREVVAVDLNPVAARNAQLNAETHGLADRIHAKCGDLWEPVQGSRFDLISFNPPFYRGSPHSAPDLAWRGEDVFERFADRLAAHLTSDGCALVLLSTEGSCGELLDLLQQSNFALEIVVRRPWLAEVQTVYRVRVQR